MEDEPNQNNTVLFPINSNAWGLRFLFIGKDVVIFQKVVSSSILNEYIATKDVYLVRNGEIPKYLKKMTIVDLRESELPSLVELVSISEPK